MGQKRTRVHYSIDEDVAQLFARVSPHRKMSQIIQQLIAKWCSDNMEQLIRENELEMQRLSTVVTHAVSES